MRHYDWQIAKDYLRFWFRSGNEYQVHSPFIYDFYAATVRSKKWYYFFDEAKKLRRQLLEDSTQLKTKDLGAGSRVFKDPTRRVADVARHSVNDTHSSRFLFRLIDHLQPLRILELGTSLGLNTLYMAAASPSNATVDTFEGCPETAARARKLWKKYDLNISLHEGDIDETLPTHLKDKPRLDLVFFDANHTYEPTVNYFEICLEKAWEKTVFVFDDIYLSEEMKEAWRYINTHAEVGPTIDFFRMGVAFFTKKQAKQHFFLRF